MAVENVPPNPCTPLQTSDHKVAELKRKELNIRGLEDAKDAGSACSENCTLILTQGYYGKDFAMNGLSFLGSQDKYGVFPLNRRKLPNVRRASEQRLLKDKNIQKIMDILGLQYGKIYKDAKELRYGHLMIMAEHGSHIKGLLINFLNYFWPSLLRVPNFLCDFIIPIVKASNNETNQVFWFHTIPEYEAWKEGLRNKATGYTIKFKASNNETNEVFWFHTIPEYEAWKEGLRNKATEYTIKFKASNNETNGVFWFHTIPEYEAWKEGLRNKATGYKIVKFKGLATLRGEAEFFFAHLDEHIKVFDWVDDEDDVAIERAFSQDLETINDWLRATQASTYFDSKAKHIRYLDFINKEFKQCVVADLQRSIPSMVDGLKPDQRKILFCAFKKPIIDSIGVDQFSDYVLKHSAYHHGEAHLVDTLIGMAQDFIGSNNINLLQPHGQFGTRLRGGKNHASGRLDTQLSPVTRYLFHKDDELVLNYLNDRGQSIEPEWFIPIIPMVLVNGSKFIPNYNPRDIIANLKRLLKHEETVRMLPWYKGFKGDIWRTSSKEYTTTGIIKQVGKNEFSITELPVRMWILNYKKFLEAASQDGKDIKFYTTHPTTAHFKIYMTEDQMNIASLKKLNLKTKLSTANMHLFNAQGELEKYDTPEQILEEFFTFRLGFYGNRRTARLRQLKKDILLLENKLKYIDIVRGYDRVYKKTKATLCDEFKAKGLLSLLSIEKEADHATEETKEEEEVAPIEESPQGNDGTGYDYLFDLGIFALDDKMEVFEKKLIEKNEQFKNLINTTAEALWLKDLEALENKLIADGEYAITEHMANINFQSSHDDEESTPEIAEAPKKKAPAKRERDAAIASLERPNKKRCILVSDSDEEEPENKKRFILVSDSDEEEPEDDSDEEEPEDDNDAIEDSDFEDEDICCYYRKSKFFFG